MAEADGAFVSRAYGTGYAFRVDPREAPRSHSAPHTVDGPALVVVGVDGSATAWRAFAWACGHARRAGCALLCVYVSTRGFWDSLVPWGQAGMLLTTGA